MTGGNFSMQLKYETAAQKNRRIKYIYLKNKQVYPSLDFDKFYYLMESINCTTNCVETVKIQKDRNKYKHIKFLKYK